MHVTRSRQPGGRRGQVLPLVILFMFVLLGITAMVVDLGRGWVMKRELQRTADAAAIAAAEFLPSDSVGATAAARDYITRNPLRDGTVTSTQITFSCVQPAIGCSPYNAVKVELTATASTTFAKALSVNSMTTTTRSVAMRAQPKPFDVMLVVDRTGSMADSSKIVNARTAIRSFLTMVDPAGVKVGMTVFPPAPATGTTCSAFSNTQYNQVNAKWATVPLATDYATNGVLNTSSQLVTEVNCLSPNGSTHYTSALRTAQSALTAQGRPDAQDIIIFLTDGAANIAPSYAVADDKARPCGSAVSASGPIKASGTRIFTIAYNVTDAGCLKDTQTWSRPNVAEGISPLTALQQIASTGDYYYLPTPTQLTTIFADIAGELGGTKTRLRDDTEF